MERSNEHMLIWVGDLDGLFILYDQIFMQRFRVTLSNIEHARSGNLSVFITRKVMNHLSCRILATQHRETR